MLAQTNQVFTDFFTRAKGDLVYALLLLISALAAFLLRQFASLGVRRRLDGPIGLAIAWLVSGPMLLCSLLSVLAHLLLLRIVVQPKLLSELSFYGTFAYLAILRTIHFFGLPPLAFVTNAIQLIVTLRAIGLAYEVSDLRQAKKNDDKTAVAEPTTFEAFNYLYSFTGLFTGPYYTYKTYADALGKAPISWQKLNPLVGQRMHTLAWSLPALIFMTWLDPVNAVRGEEHLFSLGLPSVFIWSALAFVYLRTRIYSAWMVAESICLLAGIGVYPKLGQSEPGRGPTDEHALRKVDWDAVDTQFDAQTIDNLDIPSVEHSDGFRSGMRAWNRTVQFWLANFVYRRTGKSIRMPFTMLVSSFWHGIHPGYFLSFLTIPLCTAAEDKLFTLFPAHQRPAWFQHLWSFIRMRGFEMMACGFLLLDGWDTLLLWSRMYFWLHFTMVGTIAFVRIWKAGIFRRNGLAGGA